jgi:hypothetical protein
MMNGKTSVDTIKALFIVVSIVEYGLPALRQPPAQETDRQTTFC